MQPVAAIPFRPEEMPPDFAAGLVPLEVAPAITGYPIYLAESVDASGMRSWHVLNGDLQPIWSERAPADYDPFEELARSHGEVVDAARLGDPAAIAAWNELKQRNDPVRIVLAAELIDEADLIRYTWANSLEQAAMAASAAPPTPPAGPDSSGTDLLFTDIIRTNGELRLTVTHPSVYANQVHLLGGADLVAQDWTYTGHLDADPVSNEVVFSVSLTGPGPFSERFVAAYDNDDDGMADWWENESFGDTDRTELEDSDIDKLQNLFEYYAGTDPLEGFIDTDGDGISDDWEDYYELDATDPSDADLDPDLDGFTNLEEFLNNGGSIGTDPTDIDSYPSNAVYVDDAAGSDVTGTGSRANPYASISNGVAQAPVGGHVVILPGLYSGATNRGIVIASELKVTGIDGSASPTIIDCQSVTNAFYIRGAAAADSVLRSLEIRNGYREPLGFPGELIEPFGGGGVVCSNAPSITIQSCTFSNCGSPGDGGGLAFFEATDVTVTACSFQDCAATNSGGGLYIGSNCVDVLVADTVMEGNRAHAFFGGGLYSWHATNIVVSNCVARLNTAGGYGGGLDFDFSDDIAVLRSTIAGNAATFVSGGGMFFWNTGGDTRIRNCLLYENASGEHGGGVGDQSRQSGVVQVESCTVVDNTSSRHGGGIWTGGPLHITNSIVYFNQSSNNRDITSGTMTMDYCCVPSNVKMGDNSITNEPGFVARAADDYRLASGSACVDEGFEFPWMSSAVDLDGQPRVVGVTVDIGAFERPE